MKKVWLVRYEMNGGEYEGTMEVLAKNVRQFSNTTFIADEVTIRLPDVIVYIKEKD